MKVSQIEDINLSNQLISSLLDEIPRIGTFKGKWSLIKTKLGRLQSQLSDITDLPCFSSNFLALELAQSIYQSLIDAASVARRCQDVNMTEGKLMTQSNIDSFIAKLDRHIKDAEILIRSGVLHDGAGSGSCSKREAVRVETKSLITRLQIGSVESRNSSMDLLMKLLQEDDKNVVIALAQGVVPALVKLLDSSYAEMKEKAVCAISSVSLVESSKHALVAEGLLLLHHLIRLLECGSAFAKEKACIALQTLSMAKENARVIGSRGGISSLLEICQVGTPGAQAVAAGVLRNLLKFVDVKDKFIEENGVHVLLGLVASGTALAQENSIGCLCNLVCEDDNLKLTIVREGGVQCLKNFWDSAAADKSLEVAVELLTNLASCPPIAAIIVSEGFLARLAMVLNCCVLRVRIAAAEAVYELGFSTKTRKEMGEFGCVHFLTRMLDGKAVSEREAAAKALSNLMQYPGNRRIFRKDERGILSVVQLLDPLLPNLDKKYPVSILASMVHSKKSRKQMVGAGTPAYLQKLAEMEEDMEGAKKLLQILTRGKVWGVFSRS